MPLGEILVVEGCITKAQLKEALTIQKNEVLLPLGQILLKMHLIDVAELQRAIDELGTNSRLGDFLIADKIITKAQLDKALELQKREGKLLGETLLDLKYLNTETLAGAMIKQANKPRLGEWLIEHDLLSRTNLKLALRFQSRGRKLGDILVDLLYISRQKLNDIIDAYDKRQTLESVLVKEGMLAEVELREAQKIAKDNNENLVDVLISKGSVHEEQIQQAQAIRFELPYQRFERISFNEADALVLTKIVGAVYARKHNIIAIHINDNDVTVAIVDPEALSQVDFLKQLNSNYKFSPCFVSLKNFERIFGLLFGKEALVSLKESSTMDMIYDSGSDRNIRQLENVHLSEAIKLVNLIIDKALELKATDIHLESDAWGTQIRYRVDGILMDLDDTQLAASISASILPVISRLKVISNMDVAERRMPQDGAFRMTYRDPNTGESYPIDFRVSTIKGYGVAENVAIRVLDSKKSGIALHELNYSQSDLILIKRLLNSPSGLILVTGPTGSGKTTTLYACLKYLNKPGIKIMTSENPVEYVVPGITQVSINQRIGLTHDKVLKSFLRQDPDVVLVGEIRDEDTAEVAIKAAETGHLIMSTLHTSDPIAAILRLIDLNISLESIATTTLGIISQRLVKLNCPNCSKEYMPSEEEWQPFFSEFPISRHFYKGNGCEQCGYVGLKGRKPVYEMLLFDRHIQKLLRENADMAIIRSAAIEKGMLSMVENGMSQSKNISLTELIRTQPYHLIEEFKTNPTILSRNKT